MKRNALLLVSLVFAAGSAMADMRATPDASAAVPATRQGPTAPAVDAFSALDANHDGVLSKSEMARHAKSAHMAMVDENRDGVLSRDEFAALEDM